MFKIQVFIPETHVDDVKAAMFTAGAGRIGNYDSCCWQTKGEGQFRALDGSQPFIGEQDKTEIVVEYKVEMVCDDALMQAVIQAMKKAHPYEEPAFDVIKLHEF